MTSSTLSGDRRWASSRRSGMTVLGKVAVPKPINLPSQRLENHGLDPNVEIVPKGTLSWGSKSSSSSNAWGSSTLSPNTDGGSGSPSHLSARPSSGGSGTRPSTAGSDRAHEPANAWGSNSRPSSASGALASSQSSLASLRPRSAETRPGSSQLSRFAETIPENSGAWGASGTAEKLGMTSSKNDGFSLASGDFPTLGSEKDSTGKNAELQDHGSQGRPGSSSGVASMKERTGTSTVVDVSANANPKSGSVNSWRRDNPPYSEDGVRPSMEKWHADPQGPHPPYPNTGIPPQHYDAWHGPPINNHPGGVWYRGPPGGPPYGPPPGAFPMEPFPYYRPQIPGNALGNPQPVPPPGAGPRGPHPKNGDMYRGPMPDAFVRPGMPIRPPFYPGPVAYEGYYGPPMGYCNSNERDIPFMGMPGGPSPHNRYPGQNASDHGGSHARPSGYGPPGKALAAEHLESGHPHDVRGPYKVLLKQHDGWDGKDEENRWEDDATATVEKGDRHRTSSWENDWKADQRKEEEVKIRRVQSPGQIIDHHGGDSILGKVKSSDAVDNAKAYDDISAKRVEYSEVPATTKDSNLIQQIEGLNAKARASDGRLESVSVYNREEQKNKSQVVNAKAKHFANEVATGSRAAFTGKMPASGMSEPTSNEVGFSAADKSLDVPADGAGVNRRSTHGMHTRPDHHRGRGRFNPQDADGWRKRPPYTDSSNVRPATDSENPSNVNMQDYMSLEASEKSVLLSYPQARDEGESMQPVFDPSDSQSKRAMMRELAKQRVKQRQKEEEERARDQKAKALAKLEELNRRTQMGEGLTQKLESVPDSATQSKQEECQTLAEESILTSRSAVTSLAPVSNPFIDADVGQSSTGGLEKPTVFNNQQPLVSTKNVHKASTDMCEQSLPVQQRVNTPDASINNHPQVSDGSTSKQKRVGYKKRDNNSMDKNSSEKPISTGTIELPKHTDAAVDVAPSAETVVKENVPSPEFISAQNVVNEPSVQQRRKNNRSGKSKHKMEEASSIAPLPSGISKDTNLSSTSAEGSKPKSSEIESDPRPVQSLTDSKDGNRSSEQDSAPNEEVHGRVNNQWKSQHSRRMPRNAQTHRSAVHSNDAVVWAPVRPHNKVEVIEEESHKAVVDAVAPQVKNDPQVQSNTRSKRAEMERYIPKPVAKEMAQQVISQQPVALSDNQNAAEETGGRVDSGSHGVECSQPVGFAVGKVENSTESRNDGRQSRQGRGHGSWRQRASSEATVQGLQDGQYSNQGKNTRKTTEHNQQQKPDLSLVKEQPKYDEWNTSDGWNMPEAPDSSAPPVVPVVRDQGVTGRGKRQAFKGHKGGGSNHDFDHKKINNGEAEKVSTQSPVHEMAQSDLPATPKENRVGDRSTSQWQPKSSASNHRGTRPDTDQNVGPEIGRANKKDTAQGKVSLPSQPEKETTGSMTQPLKDQYIPDKQNVEETHNAGHYESKRERKVGSLKGRPQSPNQGLDLPMEAPPSNVDNRNEQRTTSGFRKNGNQHNRFGRGHESRGEWGLSGQEIRQQHNPPANRDRPRHNNSHYEYQPVGPQNNSRPNNPEGPKDATHTGGRFRDRGQSHSRRGGGNFHGRQSGAVRVDGGYE